MRGVEAQFISHGVGFHYSEKLMAICFTYSMLSTYRIIDTIWVKLFMGLPSNGFTSFLSLIINPLPQRFCGFAFTFLNPLH